MNILQQCAWNIFLPRKEILNVKFCGMESRDLFGNAMKEHCQFSENIEQHVDIIFYISDSKTNAFNKISDELSELRSNSLFFLINKADEYDQLNRISHDHQNIILLTNMTIDGEVLYDKSLEWITSIPRTGKLDYFIRTLKWKGITIFITKEKNQLTIFSRKNVNSWVYKLLFDFNQKKYLQTPVRIGRIDKMRTGNTVIQVRDKMGEKYCIKIFGGDSKQNAECLCMPWLDKLGDDVHVSQAVRSCIPRVISASEFNGLQYQLETWMTGKPASLYFYNKTQREEIIDRAVDWSIEFQGASRSLNSSFELELNKVSRNLEFFTSRGDFTDSITTKITAYVSNKLSQYDCPVVSCHGDFWIANLLVDENKNISGVIDWDYSEEKTAPLIDIFHILFHRKTMFSVFSPWKELENSLRGKSSYNDRVRIRNCMDKLGISPELFTCLLIVYWLRYLDTRYETMYKYPGWYDSAFIRIYELLAAQSTEDWDKLSRRMMEL